MKKILFLLLFTSISQTMVSQVNRNVGRVPNTPRKEVKKVDPVEVSLNFIKKELNLDTFQEAATKTFLEDNAKERSYILSLDIANSDKIERLRSSRDNMDAKMISVLNENQKAKYLELKSKTDKNSKKSKNNKEEKTAEEIELEELKQD